MLGDLEVWSGRDPSPADRKDSCDSGLRVDQPMHLRSDEGLIFSARLADGAADVDNMNINHTHDSNTESAC